MPVTNEGIPRNKRPALKLDILYEAPHSPQPIMDGPAIELEPTPLYEQTLPPVGKDETSNNWKNKKMGFNMGYTGIVYTPNNNNNNNDTIRKVYKFTKNARDNVLPKFKMEIFMQMKAHTSYNHINIPVELSNDNAPESNELNVTVSVPEIYGYGDITYGNSYDIDTDYFYIDMENIIGQTMQEVIDNDYNLCAQFDTIVDKIDYNFQQNKIFHNDMNARNILIREISIDDNKNITNLDVVVIDFGDALEEVSGRGAAGVNSTLTICNKSTRRRYSGGKGGTRKIMKKIAHKKSNRQRGGNSKRQRGGNSKKTKRRKFKKLFDAIDIPDYDKVEDALNNGANVNAQNKDGETPLIRAIKVGNKDIVYLLLEHGANVNAQNKDGEDGETPLIHAIKVGNKDIVYLLLEHPDIELNLDTNKELQLNLDTNKELQLAEDLTPEGEDQNGIPYAIEDYIFTKFREAQEAKDAKDALVGVANKIGTENPNTNAARVLGQYVPVTGKNGKKVNIHHFANEINEYVGGKRKTRKKNSGGRKPRKK